MLSQYHYYSGMIFKAYTYGVGNPIVQGGRYNHLLSQFGKQAPAVGFVMQVDDLLSALNSQGIVIPKSAPKTILHYHDENYLQQVLEAQRLRQLGDKVVLLREID
jgi:ATP phosphoribosyltransferase regulatory subunit